MRRMSYSLYMKITGPCNFQKRHIKKIVTLLKLRYLNFKSYNLI